MRRSIWVKRATVGVAVLAALLLGYAALRAAAYRTAAGRTDPAPSAAGVAPPPTGVAPLRPVPRPVLPAGGSDRVKITIRPATGRPAAPAPIAASPGRPRFPWTRTPETCETLRAWAARIEVNSTDATLTEVLDIICSAAGIAYRFVGECRKEEKISFHAREMMTENCLRLLVRQYGLVCDVGADGVLVIGPEEVVPVNEPLKAARGLERAQRLKSGAEKFAAELAREEQKMTEALRAERTDLEVEGATLADAIARLRVGTKANILLHGSLSSSPAPDPPRRISFRGGNRTLDEVLREVAALAGLDLVFESGVVLLNKAEEVADLRRRNEAKSAHIAELLARPVAFAGGTVEGYDLSGVLKAQTGIEVVVDESVWNREAALPVAPGARPLGEALDDVCGRSGLQWRLLEDVLYVF
ncbi:MAG: hypothetical protein HZA54_17315 [Planctomycetes bacterium]|nr:hypothetical protein [Planctomycetota bacterium]